MSEETPPKTVDKRPFSKLYRDVGVSLRGDSGCITLYFTILTEVSWGDHKKRLRRVYEVSAGQFLTSISELQKLTKMHRTTVQNCLNILAEMGIVSIETLPNVGLRLTLVNTCLKSIQDATKIIKDAEKWTYPTKYKPTGKRPTKTSTQSQLTGKGEKYPVNCDGVSTDYPVNIDCLNSEYPVNCDWVTPFPSSVLEEEEFNKNISKERNQNPSPSEPDLPDDYNFSDLDFGEEIPPPEPRVYYGLQEALNDAMGPPPPPEETYPLELAKEMKEVQGWLEMIKEAYPRAKCELTDLIKIMREGKKVLKSANVPPDEFIVIISYVWHKGNDYQKAKFFKSPKDILKQDDLGTTILEEIGLSYKTYLKKAESKYSRGRRY